MVITARTTLHFHPLQFQLCLGGKRILFHDSGNCGLSSALKDIAQKGRLASCLNGGYMCQESEKLGIHLKSK